MIDIEQTAGVRAASSSKTVLLVDHRDGLRLFTKWFLNNFGHAVQCARTGQEALELFDPGVHDIVVAGPSLRGTTCEEMVRMIGERAPRTPVLAMSASPSQPASRFLQEPAYFLGLKDAIDGL